MKSNQMKVGVILTYVSMILSTLLSIVYTPFMLKSLGQSEYGLYQLISSIVNYLSLLSLGFGSSYIRFFTKYNIKNDKDGIASLNGMYMIIFVCISIISLMLGMFLTFRIDIIFEQSMTVEELEIARKLTFLLVINIIGTFISSVFNSYITAHERFIFQKGLHLVQAVMHPLLCFFILILGYKSIAMVLVSTFITYAILLINLWYCKKKLSMSFDFKNKKMSLIREISVFSSFILLNAVVDQINWSVDKLILGVVVGTAGVATYGLAAQINVYFQQLSTAVSSVFVPRINNIVAKKESTSELTLIFTKVGRIQFLILSLVLTGYIFLGKPFMLIWGGPEYENSYYIALLLMIPVTIPLIQNLGIEILRAKNMQAFRSISYIIIAIVNIFISIPLCRAYGAIGCAIGTALTMIIGNGIIINIYYHQKVRLDILFFWKSILKIFPGLIAPTAVGIYIMNIVTITRYLDILIYGFIYCIIFSCSMWLLGCNQYERKLIVNLIKRIINLPRRMVKTHDK